MKTWEDIRQSELSKTEKGKYHVTSLTCRAKVSKCISASLRHLAISKSQKICTETGQVQGTSYLLGEFREKGSLSKKRNLSWKGERLKGNL